MGLVQTSATQSDKSSRHLRKYTRDLQGLLRQLEDGQAKARRWAARDLAAHPEAAQPLCRQLSVEPDASTREAILASLLTIGTSEVVDGLVRLLRSDDAALRNGAIDVLRQLPEAVAPHMETLLSDSDPDVRIFALDILQGLTHPKVTEWLAAVLTGEEHPNVVATAVDRAAEIGTPEMAAMLEKVAARFPTEPFIRFSVDTALDRIAGGGAG